MKISKLFQLELMKTKRSFILPIFLFPPLLVAICGVLSMRFYLEKIFLTHGKQCFCKARCCLLIICFRLE